MPTTPPLRAAAALGCALCALAVGCASVPPPLPGGLLGEVANPRSYCGEIRIRHAEGESAVSGTAIVLAKPPERAELLVTDPFGRIVAEYLVTPDGIRARRTTGEVVPIPEELLPSPSWFPVAFTLLGGRLPGEPTSPPVPVAGGYRASYRFGELTLTVHLDHEARVRRVVGEDGIEVFVAGGRGGFPSLRVTRGPETRLEVMPLTLSECEDPFGGAIR